MKDFSKHTSGIQMATSAIVREYARGTDVDPYELTSLILAQNLGDDTESSINEHNELLVAARVSGRLAVLHYDRLTGGRLSRVRAVVEVGLSQLFDPYARSAMKTGIPQNTAMAVASGLQTV